MSIHRSLCPDLAGQIAVVFGGGGGVRRGNAVTRNLFIEQCERGDKYRVALLVELHTIPHAQIAHPVTQLDSFSVDDSLHV